MFAAVSDAELRRDIPRRVDDFPSSTASSSLADAAVTRFWNTVPRINFFPTCSGLLVKSDSHDLTMQRGSVSVHLQLSEFCATQFPNSWSCRSWLPHIVLDHNAGKKRYGVRSKLSVPITQWHVTQSSSMQSTAQSGRD